MSSTSPIKGKIVSVVTTTGILINKGKLDGVTEKSKFKISMELGPFTDPDQSWNVLSALTFTKGTIKIASVFDHMAYGTLEGSSTTVYPINQLFSSKLEYPETAVPLVSPEDWKIKVGDTVTEVKTSSIDDEL